MLINLTNFIYKIGNVVRVRKTNADFICTETKIAIFRNVVPKHETNIKMIDISQGTSTSTYGL